MAQSDYPTTTSARVDDYNVAMPLLKALFTEFKDQSKKKPDALVSKLKIAIVNRLLERCRRVLNDEPQLEFLDVLDSDVLPQASDAVLVLSQYESAMTSFRRKYCHSDGVYGDDYWHVEDGSDEALAVDDEGDDDEEDDGNEEDGDEEEDEEDDR